MSREFGWRLAAGGWRLVILGLIARYKLDFKWRRKTKMDRRAALGAFWALPRLLGLRKALEVALLAEPFDAAEALRLGLVNRVVATERLAEVTSSWPRAWPPRAPQSFLTVPGTRAFRSEDVQRVLGDEAEFVRVITEVVALGGVAHAYRQVLGGAFLHHVAGFQIALPALA